MGSNREEELRRGDFHSLNFDFCHFLKAPDLSNDVCCIEVLSKRKHRNTLVGQNLYCQFDILNMKLGWTNGIQR